MSALLVGLVSFHSAYLLVVLASLTVVHGQANLALFGLVTAFTILAVAVPVVVPGLKRWGDKPLPAWMGKLPGVAELVDAIADAPIDLLRDPKFLAGTTAAQTGVFLLDATTLWLAFHALGQPTPAWIALAGFMVGSIAETVDPTRSGWGPSRRARSAC